MYNSNFYGDPYGVSRTRSDNNFGANLYSAPTYQSPINNIIWVQGEAGAKAYQLPPNSNIILMDNDDLILYVKSTDNVGMATTRTFKLTEITNEMPNGLITQKSNANNNDYVTRQEFEELKGMIENAKSNIYTNANTNNKYSNNNNNGTKSNDK